MISIFSSYTLNSNIFFARSSVIKTVIEIDGNQMLLDYCSEGTGTVTDPLYIREKIFSSNNSGFIIKNTDLYLIIINCSINGKRESKYTAAIILLNSKNINIVNSYINFYSNGISVINSSNIKIMKNVIYSNHLNGISIINSENVRISLNNIEKNIKNGIKLFQSENVLIWSNYIHNNNEDGINFEYSNNNEIKGSYEISDNQRYGIRLFNSNYNIIQNNVMERNSIECIYSFDSTNNSMDSNSYFCTTVYETTEILEVADIPPIIKEKNSLDAIIVIFSIFFTSGMIFRYKKKIGRFLGNIKLKLSI
jgi:parallel beta-helix repeat protein